jgi:hypothetical protein
MKEANGLKKRRKKKKKGLRNIDVQDTFETGTNAAYNNNIFNGKKAVRLRRSRNGRQGKLKPEKH